MSEIFLDELRQLRQKVEDLESLFSRRLLDDKSKNVLINDLKSYLIYRQDLDSGVAFSKMMLDVLRINDRLIYNTPSVELNTSIYEEMVEMLQKYGLSPISERIKLDPKVHEVVSVVECSDVEDGTILEVVQTGYTVGNKVLRPSKVIVSRFSEEEEIDLEFD